MFKDRDCLTHFVTMLLGTSVAGAGIAGVPIVGGALEALVAGTGLLSRLDVQRRTSAERLIKRTAKQVENEWEGWIKSSSQTNESDLANAVASFEECILKCAPTPADVVGQKLQADAIANLVLARAEAVRPNVYGDNNPRNTSAAFTRRFLHTLTLRSYRLLLKNPDFYNDIAPDLWKGLFGQLGEIGSDIKDVRLTVEGIRQHYARELEIAQKTLHARETDLVSLLAFILQKRIAPEDVLTALEQSYEKLKDLRANWSDLKTLANEEPEIAQILQQADTALQSGEHFSLETAEKALATADERYEKLNKERKEQFKRGQENRARILRRRAVMAALKFNYGEAAEMCRHQAACLADAFGEEHSDTANCYGNLANYLDAQGRFQEAEGIYRKTLTVLERVLGEEHFDTLIGYSNLAHNLSSQGRLVEAEPLFRKALDISERILGTDNQHTASRYNNIAYNLNLQGRFAEAESLFRKALDIRTRVLGSKHPSTAESYNNIAHILSIRGQPQDAELVFRKALKIIEGLFGEEHPTTAIIYNNIALTLRTQGHLKDAERLFRKSLCINERILGSENPNTTVTYSNLALVLNDQGRLKEAEKLFRRTIEIRERILGNEHPDTASSYDKLGSNLYAQGQPAEAASLFVKAMNIRMRIFGDDHPDTAASFTNVAQIYRLQGKPTKAKKLLKKALKYYQKNLGDNHSSTQFSLKLINILRSEKKRR